MKKLLTIAILLASGSVWADSIGVQSGSVAQSSGIGLSSSDLSLTQISVPQDYRTMSAPQIPVPLASSANIFTRGDKGPVANAAPVANFLDKACNTTVAESGTDSDHAIEFDDKVEYDKTTVEFAPYFDIQQSGLVPNAGIESGGSADFIYDFAEYFANVGDDERFVCIGTSTVYGREQNSVSPQHLLNDAKNFAISQFGKLGKLLIVADHGAITDIEGVDSNGDSMGGGINSAGNAGMPIIGAAFGMANNETVVTTVHNTASTYQILMRVPSDVFGHNIGQIFKAKVAQHQRNAEATALRQEYIKQQAALAARNAVGSGVVN